MRRHYWSMSEQRFIQPFDLDRLLAYPRGRSARLARKGLIPCVHLPDGELRFDRERIERWLQQRTDDTNGGDA